MKAKKRQMSPAAADTSGPPAAAAQQPARPSEVLPTSRGSLLPFAAELDRNLITTYTGQGAAAGAGSMDRVRINNPNARAIGRLLTSRSREGRTEVAMGGLLDELIEYYVLAHGGYDAAEIQAARVQVVASRQRAADTETERARRKAALAEFEKAKVEYARKVQEAADQAERDRAADAERAAKQLQVEREERATLMRDTGARETKQLEKQRFEFDVEQELQRRAAPRLLEALLPK